jgi:FKBP-type peptidyl-prolyl cis-trans isomerase 2
MVLAKGDFVRINYVGRVKESGAVFDTTSEDVAKEGGIYDEKIQFKASPIVVGASHVIPGLDEALVGMEVGEKKTVMVSYEKGYGARDPKLVKVVHINDFRKQGMRPVPGMRIEADGRVGRVQSVSGGRVRVDFNYELAGKALEYEVSIKEKVNKLEEKIRLLLELHMPFANPNDHEVALKNKVVVIRLPDVAKLKKESMLSKHYVARDAFRFLALDEVLFEEVFTKPKSSKKTGKTTSSSK